MSTLNIRKFLLLVVILVFASPGFAATGPELPVSGVITSGVGWRPDPFGTGKRMFHRGIDIAVPTGTPVHATRKGRVVLAGDDNHGHGNTVIIEHDNGDRTLYGHNSKILVRAGQAVEAGAAIALSGTSGRSTGPHVHFEELPGGRRIAAKPDVAVATASRPGTGNTQLSVASAAKQMEISNSRQAAEKKMDEAVDSILGALTRARFSGQDG